MGRRFFWVDLTLDFEGWPRGGVSASWRGPACVETSGSLLLGAGNGCPPGAPRLDGTVLMPALCNAHIHVLDAAIPEAGEELGLHELVAQPHGLKYRLLSATPMSRLREAAATVFREMKRVGVGYAAAYAEMGEKGAAVVEAAAEEAGVRVLVLAQPTEKRLAEALVLASRWHGVGLDTPLDLEAWETRLLAGVATVHAHVSEDPSLASMLDLEAALEAGVHGLIHLTHASPGLVLEAAGEGRGVVLCPRSNLYHEGARPPLEALPSLYSEGLAAGLGSDNAAWLPFDPLGEAFEAYLQARSSVEGWGRLLLGEAVLYASTLGCRLIAAPGEDEGLYIVKRVPLVAYSSHPPLAVVKRGQGMEATILLSRPQH